MMGVFDLMVKAVEDGTRSAFMPCRSGVCFPASFVRRCAVCAVFGLWSGVCLRQRRLRILHLARSG
jgi:hypothetical protein